MARYIYAIWPIEPLEMTRGFLVHQEWAAKAAEFSFLNLEEGEIAGQLAFGQSYFSGRLFTSQNIYVSYALFTSAVSCGFREAGLEMIVNNYFNSEQNKYNSDNIRLRVVSMAKELETYCY